MKYGINLLLWGANIGEGHYGLLEQIKRWGFDGVEIPTFGADEPRYRKLGQKLKEIGLQCTTCVIVQKDTNPLDESAAVRQKGVDFLKEMVDHNREVGVIVADPSAIQALESAFDGDWGYPAAQGS